MSLTFHIHSEELVPAIQSLEDYFRDGGTSIVQAAFQHTYFIHPKAVLMRTPFSPDRARRSREHYPGIDKGQKTFWKAGDGREIILDDNSRAQLAWQGYTGHKLARGSGYGVRHIWGNTHNPEAFTAGWNLCYMPFWAGMLTEDQHPHPELHQAIRQASWDLFLSGIPVCEPPEFVSNPGVDLGDIMDGNLLLIMSREPERVASRGSAHRDTEGPTLPIVLEPENAEDFKRALLRTKEAWIEVSYQDGRKEQGGKALERGPHAVHIQHPEEPQKQTGVQERGLARKWYRQREGHHRVSRQHARVTGRCGEMPKRGGGAQDEASQLSTHGGRATTPVEATPTELTRPSGTATGREVH